MPPPLTGFFLGVASASWRQKKRTRGSLFPLFPLPGIPRPKKLSPVVFRGRIHHTLAVPTGAIHRQP
jgi:hypothetical protein